MRDPVAEETIRNTWADIMIALVRSYGGKRMKMWTRIPDVMEGAARQTSRLDRWFTLTLRGLQIGSLGSSSNPSSLCSTWWPKREALRNAGNSMETAERQALLLLREERATITALAQIRWDAIKEMSR